MKIESPTEDRIIVELSEEDMRELDITYEDMDYSTSETRRVMWTLLDRAGKQLGRDINPAKRMMIETLPGICGGCTVCFTILEKGTAPCSVFKQSEYLTFEFENADCLLDAVKALGIGSRVPGKLYTSGGRYRLSASGKDAYALRRALSEYARVIEGKGCAEFTCEHWQATAVRENKDSPAQRCEGKQ